MRGRSGKPLPRRIKPDRMVSKKKFGRGEEKAPNFVLIRTGKGRGKLVGWRGAWDKKLTRGREVQEQSSLSEVEKHVASWEQESNTEKKERTTKEENLKSDGRKVEGRNRGHWSMTPIDCCEQERLIRVLGKQGGLGWSCSSGNKNHGGGKSNPPPLSLYTPMGGGEKKMRQKTRSTGLGGPFQC